MLYNLVADIYISKDPNKFYRIRSFITRQKFITSGIADNAALYYSDIAAVPISAPFFIDLPGFFFTKDANFLADYRFSRLLPNFLKNLPSPSVTIKISQAIIDSFNYIELNYFLIFNVVTFSASFPL